MKRADLPLYMLDPPEDSPECPKCAQPLYIGDGKHDRYFKRYVCLGCEEYLEEMEL